MNTPHCVATLGCGVIGSSWTALFLAAGYRVNAFDVAPDTHKTLVETIEKLWPTLSQLGYDSSFVPARLRVFDNPLDAVKEADFIQENVPERIDIKHALFAQIEPHLKTNAIVASSASGLMLSEMQAGWKSPNRFILGHPFNPPHLIPLVELLANEKTDHDVLPLAESFYQSLNKVTIRVKKEVPAHVANRLQAALWREAINLVAEGVASVDDVDKAVWAGPGLRWAAMGPHQLFHLGAGTGGLQEFCARYADSFHRWWDDLGDARLNPDVVQQLVSGVIEKSTTPATDTASSIQAPASANSHLISAHEAESRHRDQLIVAMLNATRGIRAQQEDS